MPVDEAGRLLAGLAGRPALKLVAVHMHVGSQMTSLDPVRAAAARLAGFARQAQEAGITLEYLDAGGGLGISYDGGPVPSADRYAAALVDEIRPTHLPIVVEPGRSIVGPAGGLLAQVGEGQARTASSDFAIIDAGMTELMRPALYNGFHRIDLSVRARAACGSTKSPGRSARAPTSWAATARCRRSPPAISSPSDTAPTDRPWPPTTTAARSPRKCSWTTAHGASSGSARRSTICSLKKLRT